MHTNLVGDCLEKMKTIGDASVDLIMTSPPYADARKTTYGGPAPDEYVEWFMPIADEMRRCMKPTGTFMLNIKEKVVNGERHTYVLELIIAMRKSGWLWTEEWIWHKKNCFPGKWPNRFRDAFERILQFNLNKKFVMNQDSVMHPVGEWAESRLKNLSDTDKVRDESGSGSSFGKRQANWLGRDLVYPSNVLHLATECSNKDHPAAYPEGLASFFIKLFSNKGSTVLDPFQGSGTTGISAVGLERDYVGIEISEVYSKIAAERIEESAKKAIENLESLEIEDDKF